ncbi:hypothetical protein SK128_006630 [Halocaridina rubra]|uniref:Uncharacterized protein n=1 Tax=Halocaridina rubra TaxID=373956 RepID=A0AAN8WZ60_HALRR
MSFLSCLKVSSGLLRHSRVSRGHHLIGFQKYSYSTASENTGKDVATTSTQTGSPSQEPSNLGRLTHHRVNMIEKYLLVWGGKYKNVAEVPSFVSQDTMERARNKARIKINIMMGVATAIACLFMIISGKRAQERGESVTKINLEWHKQINEEARQSAPSPSTTN